MSDTHPQSPHPADSGENHIHVVPMKVLVGIFIALLILTFLTVEASHLARSGVLDLGGGNVIVALVIALIKATLVALYFMHLRYDSLFNGVVLIASLIFVVLFIGVSLLDSREYQPARQEYKQTQAAEAPAG